jgi:hypothetical protein
VCAVGVEGEKPTSVGGEGGTGEMVKRHVLFDGFPGSHEFCTCSERALLTKSLNCVPNHGSLSSWGNDFVKNKIDAC